MLGARRRRSKNGLWLIMAIIIIAVIVFFFEWLGSGQPQVIMEQKVAAPAITKRTE